MTHRLIALALFAASVTYVLLARALARDSRSNGSRTTRRVLKRHLSSVRSAA